MCQFTVVFINYLKKRKAKVLTCEIRYTKFGRPGECRSEGGGNRNTVFLNLNHNCYEFL